jgi:hypothetical protein
VIFKPLFATRESERNRIREILFLLPLLILNPVTLQINSSLPFSFRDTDAYVALAMDLFAEGRLYLPSWGHVDSGLILPPLYPFLISLGSLLIDDPLRVARGINRACMILTLVPIYFFLVSRTNILTAVATIALVSINSEYVFYGLGSLTEPLFLFLLCSALYFAGKDVDSGKKLFFLGILTALVFMARQVGIVLFVFMIAWMLVRAFANREPVARTITTRLGIFVLGWLVMFSPYAAVLYHQTGQTPLTQGFRVHDYSIETGDPEIISKIQRIRDKPEYNYDAIYVKRRYLQELLPDSSEMLGHVTVRDNQNNAQINEKAGPVTLLLNALRDPAQYLKKIVINLTYLEKVIGLFFLAVFLLSCITPLVVRYQGKDNLGRVFMPAFLILYLMAISTAGANVARYLQIIYPLIFAQVGMEAYHGYKLLSSKPRLKLAMPITIAALMVWSVFVTPEYFFDVRTVTADQAQNNDLSQLRSLRKYVKAGDPVFSLFANQALFSGGTFRIMPNDSLEKVVEYGKRTGVRWILVSKAYGSVNESYYKVHVKWYRDPAQLNSDPRLVRRCCGPDDTYSLYEIR